MPAQNTQMVWIVRIVLVVLVAGIRLWWHQDWLTEILLVVGWFLGYALADADHLFYVAACGPQELSCQRVRSEFLRKNWSGGWRLLKETQNERQKLPVHNVITAVIVLIAGLWLVTSSGNFLAIGLVTGLSIRLYTEFFPDANYSKWYWLFARSFSDAENKIVKYVWGAGLALLLVLVVRG